MFSPIKQNVMKKASSLLFCVILLISCGDESPTTPFTILDGDNPAATGPAEVAMDTIFAPLDTTVHNLPLEIDNDNYLALFDEKKHIPLTPSQFDALNLKVMEDRCEGCDYFVLGQVKLSEDFISRLIYRNTNGNEWQLWLANYDRVNNLTDEIEILYGDAVEYISEKFCTIAKEKITVTYKYYGYGEGNGEEETTTETFKVDAMGMFTKQ